MYNLEEKRSNIMNKLCQETMETINAPVSWHFIDDTHEKIRIKSNKHEIDFYTKVLDYNRIEQLKRIFSVLEWEIFSEQRASLGHILTRMN